VVRDLRRRRDAHERLRVGKDLASFDPRHVRHRQVRLRDDVKEGETIGPAYFAQPAPDRPFNGIPLLQRTSIAPGIARAWNGNLSFDRFRS
jgi:hypothetical protein